jgi:hypothetical protein
VAVLFEKDTPPSVDMLNPPCVAAYTVLPEAYTPLTVLLPKLFVVVLFVNVDPPSVDMLNPPAVAAYTVLPEA